MKRRKFLSTSITSALSMSLLPSFATTQGCDKQKLFRVVHVTDMHIFESSKVAKAIKKLLSEIHSLEEKPDFVLNTGDNVMDALKQKKEDVESQWNAWTSYFKNNLKYPMYSCIGNHDVWGWSIKEKNLQGDPLWGKTWAMKMLELKNRYYSFEHKGWKFFCLDSPSFVEEHHTYTAKLDKKQFRWLASELEKTDLETPVCMVSHIPLLSASVFYDGKNIKDGDWSIPGAWMHTDSKTLKDLFYEHPNVAVALSGHIHLADQTEYLGVQYHCNGAVCGGWWKGNYQEFGPAYAIVDFFSDGTIHKELVPYQA